MQHILKTHDIVKTDFVRGENCYLYDSAGKRFLDFESGIWCAALGHNHPRINAVMHDQIDRIIHLGTRYPHRLAENAAVEVLRITGLDEGKCVFLSSGSEAVEFAVQVARRITRKPRLFTFQHSYLAAYGSAGTKSSAEWQLLDWRACAGDTDCLADIPFDEVGAFAFEPGGSGLAYVRFPPNALVAEIARRVHAAGGLVIANEITTGMGRTGKWFGFQHYDVQPDMVAIGKGLGNGYPVSAVALRRTLAETLEQSGFRYAQSHQNDPLGCAVAREVIAVMREEDWIARGSAMGEFFLRGLERLQARHAIIKEARRRGLLLGLELHPHPDFTVTTVYEALVANGFLVGLYPAGNFLRLAPPLTIEEKDIALLLDALDAILAGAPDVG